jgi:hypothetical protein
MNFKGARNQIWDLILAGLSAFLLLTAFVLNYYRYELFGVVHHNAANNFWFNLTFFIPLTFCSMLFSIAAYIRVIFNWKEKPDSAKKIITLVLGGPILIVIITIILQILVYDVLH